MKVFISQPMNGRSDEEILKEREMIKQCLEKKFKEPYADSISVNNVE